ncbi:hypothetical protein Prudu_005692 [Prunus dulcis]|uniref:Uncharacterized protein n=1 Tax=Prunus dulcis TaxID=3755 RepID=A0A4Y1QY66_PRUDU|nr:hypothetical protein Prudu_005692 [Prunus dulcis]
MEGFLTPMREARYPVIRSLLCLGGMGMKSQLETMNKGVHIVVANPRRLMEILKLKRMILDHRRFLTLD